MLYINDKVFWKENSEKIVYSINSELVFLNKSKLKSFGYKTLACFNVDKASNCLSSSTALLTKTINV